ncbi:MAG: polymer-forming cytoskeletal protein [Lachnospiraceae bacterium]|nr:polymer-forming cytoskeletal protein [Lachnospiraceae bacterium]
MSFFKDFKEDLSQAARELMPGEDTKQEEFDDDSELTVNTLESELDVESELSKLDGLLEKVSKDVKSPEPAAPAATAAPEQNVAPQPAPAEKKEPVMNKIEAVPVRPAVENTNKTIENLRKVQEDKGMSEVKTAAETFANVNTMDAAPVMPTFDEASDEVAVITEGTSIKGNMDSTGSLDIRGKIDGNVSCNGKLVVTGTINGNSTSSEFFADAAKIEGEVVSSGTVKIGLGSVIIGNITATSAVIAGAIKGDIDVQGPVVVDTSAVIMGNIKSRSVQINNGAVIEGFCSQCYAEIDVESLFGEEKVK